MEPGLVANAIAYGLLVAMLSVAAYTDWKSHVVYNWLTYPTIIVGFLYWTIWAWAAPDTFGGALNGLSASAIGFAAGFFPFTLIFMMGGLGGGDVKVMAAVGALSASWEAVLGTAVYGLGIGFAMAIYLMIRHGLVKQTAKRLSTSALLLLSKQKPEIPDDSPKIPLGVAFKIGFLFAGLEKMLSVQFPWTRYFG
jgi:prepilin peptidase CpaA